MLRETKVGISFPFYPHSPVVRPGANSKLGPFFPFSARTGI